MQQKLLLWGIVIALTSCNSSRTTLSLDQVFNKHFEHKMISSGPNFPDFNTRRDSLDLFLVALHEQISLSEFQNKVGWTDEKLEDIKQLLLDKNWLIKEDLFKPTIFIATDTQGKGLYNYSIPMALEISRSIEEELYPVKRLYNSTALSKTHSFDEVAFFILSNVLLDNWQINNVERDYLKVDDRPERHGKHYYYAIMESTLYPKESFEIYGNQYNRINDSTAVSVYGNNRNEASLKLKDKNFLNAILKDAPRISVTDNEILIRIANYYKPKLIKILVKNSDYVLNVYRKSGYSQEISFEEFFIWWYHFIYTEATNILEDNNILNIPKDGNFYYILEN